MQPTSAKAFAAAIAGAIASALANYLGLQLSPEATTWLNTGIFMLVSAAVGFILNYLTVYNTSNAPTGAVIAAVPTELVGSSTSTSSPVSVSVNSAGEIVARAAN